MLAMINLRNRSPATKGHPMYLRNAAWYVAAWGHEISRDLHATQILGERVVLYRTENGDPVALEDACPHRKLPLSMGRLRGDALECGYHGLTFDCSGACVKVPGQDNIPPRAKVRSYPVADRWGLTWIWMGDPALADPSKIFHVEHYDDPSWGRNTGPMMLFDCNYMLITDNLLDPSHVSWVHLGSFGEAACEDTPLKVDLGENGVTVSRWMHDREVAPLYQPLVTFEGRADRLQRYEVRYPSLALIKAVFTPAGQGGPDKVLPPDTFIMDSYNFMTPVNERQTRYYWFQMRNVRPDCAETSAFMTKGVQAAFEEDRVILNAVQIGQETKRTPNIDLAIDGGPLRFRRTLERKIAAEAASAAQAAE
jgi:vanillate O-demethylase monooxygenase subunit